MIGSLISITPQDAAFGGIARLKSHNTKNIKNQPMP